MKGVIPRSHSPAMQNTLLSQMIAESLANHSPEQILQGAGIEKAIAANMEILRREQVMDFVAGHLVALGILL